VEWSEVVWSGVKSSDNPIGCNMWMNSSPLHFSYVPRTNKVREVQIQRRVLIGREEHVWVVREHLVPHQQPKQGAEHGTLTMPSLCNIDHNKKERRKYDMTSLALYKGMRDVR
jgi:hypothetical protein